jgi:hypothetical protein
MSAVSEITESRPQRLSHKQRQRKRLLHKSRRPPRKHVARVPIPPAEPSDIVWGVRAIGQTINKSASSTDWLIRNKQITCVRKIGGVWCASRAALLRELTGVE